MTSYGVWSFRAVRLFRGYIKYATIEMWKCDRWNGSFLRTVPVYYAVQGGSNFWVCGLNPKV